MRAPLGLCLILAAVCPAIGRAQQPTAPPDSVTRELIRLRARLDSLEQVVRRLSATGKDTAQAHDELAALRAAAAAAAPPRDTTTKPNTQFVGRTRSQPQLNPEISATGDVRILAERPGPQRNNVDVRGFEFAFQSPLDPFSNTKIILSYEDGEVGVEEGYAYWTGLPGHVRLDVGRFRQQIGELNRWHTHALPEAEYPLVVREYLGEEGLAGDGISLYWLAPATGKALGTHELWGQVTLANNPVLFDDGNRLAFLGHLKNFWPLSSATFVEIGGSALYGSNPDSDLKSTVFGANARFTWRPPSRALYQSFTLRAEGYAAPRRLAGIGDTRYGGFVGAQYQLSRRVFLGTRFDYVQPLAGGDAIWAVVPTLQWWQSEWVYVRGEWQHQSTPDLSGTRLSTDQFLVQVVWSIGPHKHENY